ncbi:serine hydrolase domain-containing protein [Amycolatopsis sp. cmx-11-51]|uniref:serine hydrolase domain-containing protein n=1 Tax=unclassified Amycolatopsis TaxID=2618356 RepID=UPI0039E5B9CE
MSTPRWWSGVVDGMTDFQREHPQNLPGAVFAAETRADGPLVAAVGEGWSAGSICNIGSMTKTFTATAVLLALAETDRLDVESPVAEFPGMEIYREDPVKRRIRVRHLLQHTTGMPVFLATEEEPPVLPGAELVGPTVPWIGSPGYTNEPILVDGRYVPSRLLTLDQVSEHIMRTYPLRHEPGADYTYSSANYVVAGRLVERLTGKSPNVFLAEKLFRPLGMRDSFFVAQPTGDARVDEDVTAEQRARIAGVSLITRDGQWPPEVAPGPDGGWDILRRNWRFVYPDGGMYTTAADLLAFLRAVRDDGVHEGEQVLPPAVVKLMVTDHGFGHTMAFGYRRSTTPYGQGPGTLDHLGNIMTYFWCDPRDGDPLHGVFLSQRLANAIVNNNMVDGMRAIFRGFVPLVSKGAR